MIGTDEAKLLESGCSIVVGTVDADGAPDASRGWGAWSLDGGTRVRVLLPETERRTIANLRSTTRMAITFTDVVTLRSLQVKGRSSVVEAPTAADLELSRHYVDEFFRQVGIAEGSSPEVLRNLLPAGLVAVECVVECTYDQTPGPAAGAALAPTAR